MSLFGRLFQSKGPRADPGTPLGAASSAVQDLYTQATAAYQARDFAGAIPLYGRVVALQPDHAEAHYKHANALKELGQLDAALAGYDAAIRHRPDFQYAWCNRGVVQQALRSYDAALSSFERAIALDPNDLVAHSNRAAVLLQMSRWQDALDSFERILALNPTLPDAWLQRGNLLKQLQQPQAALTSYREASKLRPDFLEAHYNAAVLLERSGRLDDALAGYERAIQIQPQFYQAQFNRAGLLTQLKQLPAALQAYDGALAIKPDYAEAWCNRGAVLQELARLDEAGASYEQALALRPEYAQCYLNRATLLGVKGQWDLARADCDRAVAIRPDFVEAYNERAGVYLQIGQPDAALADYDRAIQVNPQFAEAQYNRALALLLKGDYRNGWALYEWRWRNGAKLGLPPPEECFPHVPLWLGSEPIGGKKLLVYGEQGLGDTLQFARFTDQLASLGAKVTLRVKPALATLLQTLDGVAEVCPEDGPPPEADYRCPIMSLPLALKLSLDTIPHAQGYLRSNSQRVAEWRARLGPTNRPRIGLVWSGNAKQGNDRNRSFALIEWIDQLPREFDYICLQKDIRAADQATLAANPWITRCDAQLADFSDTAALCECLDLVVSVCTSVTHLCGALHVPTWVLLPFNADWRWLLGRTDSPWYQSVRLYRQHAIGDWPGVFARVAADLRTTFRTNQ